MNKFKIILTSLTIFALATVGYFLATSYSNDFNQNIVKTDTDKKDFSDINDTVMKFYSSSYFSLGFSNIDAPHIDFSQDLSNIINKKLSYRNELVKNAKKDEKVESIEGNVFVSLFEGATKVEVLFINKNNNIANVKILATYDLSKYYEDFKPLNWSDEVILKKEANGWKIDNILYQGDEKIRNVKEESDLKSFLKTNN